MEGLIFHLLTEHLISDLSARSDDHSRGYVISRDSGGRVEPFNNNNPADQQVRLRHFREDKTTGTVTL